MKLAHMSLSLVSVLTIVARAQSVTPTPSPSSTTTEDPIFPSTSVSFSRPIFSPPSQPPSSETPLSASDPVVSPSAPAVPIQTETTEAGGNTSTPLDPATSAMSTGAGPGVVITSSTGVGPGVIITSASLASRSVTSTRPSATLILPSTSATATTTSAAGSGIHLGKGALPFGLILGTIGAITLVF